MATTTKTAAQGTYVYFGSGLHRAKDNADASRQYVQWLNGMNLSGSKLASFPPAKDGRIYTDGKIAAHVAYDGRVWATGKEVIASNMKLAEDELDDKGVIASFTKLLLKHLTDGDDVTEQLHALNYLRQQAGMKPISIPAGLVEPKQQEAPKSAPPREEQQQHREPEEGKAGPVMALALNIPYAYQPLPDNDQYTNRFDIKSESSNKLYRIAQHKKRRSWSCSCPGWISRRKCKHLSALGLPNFNVPFEPKLKSGSMKTAGKFRLYTGPTIVKQTA